VVEVSRQNNQLDKAVRYFCADKVFVKDFQTAANLQKLGIKDIVTEDGTEFKQGMISGGQHTNIFHLTFGTNQLDR
jgi:chromosome segregation ATPase